MDLGLKGKRAIVMAASRGLGYASALGLAREGCKLIVCSRDQARIEAAAATINQETGADVKALVADVSSASEAKRLVDAAVSAYGGLEIVVHNAGGPPAGETLQMTEEQWQKAFEQNLLSFTRIVGAAAPEMKKAGYGRVLTIASSSIKQPIPNLALSNALRAGVWGIAKTLSRELAPQGILVNVIAPGRIDTERIAELDQANAQKSGKSVEDVRKASIGGIHSDVLAGPRSWRTLSYFSLPRRAATLPARPLPSMARLALLCSAVCVSLLLVEPVRGQVVVPAPVPAPVEEPRPEFSEFVVKLREQALAQGVTPATIEAAFTNLEPLEIVVERDRSQPETQLTIDQYVSRRLTRGFVRTAAEKQREHRTDLVAIAKKYGVSSSVLVAIWGMESNFGRFMGTRPTVQALATLAWEGRRRAFFTTELIDALQILDKGYIELDQMKGSWAGAMGQTQFMPSSYLAHAQDFDGDGRRDIWNTLPDVFASIANYMIAYGWKGDELWGREVRVPAGRRLEAGGVGWIQAERMPRRARTDRADSAGEMAVPRCPNGDRAGALPKVARSASLLGAGKKAYLVYSNYDSLLGYNCAHAYALAVGAAV
jgi:membrane-bound lytic murein transglycosylase B